MAALLFLVLAGLIAFILLSHMDKVIHLLRGDIAGAFPMLFTRRRAGDGKGFYARVNDHTDNYSSSKYPSAKYKDSSQFTNSNAEESFTL